MSLLLDAYQKRYRVAIVSFRRDSANVNLPPTTSVYLAGKLLTEMPVGGRTPLSAGLVKTHEQVRNILLKDPSAKPIVILITDGKSNSAMGRKIRWMRRFRWPRLWRVTTAFITLWWTPKKPDSDLRSGPTSGSHSAGRILQNRRPES